MILSAGVYNAIFYGAIAVGILTLIAFAAYGERYRSHRRLAKVTAHLPAGRLVTPSWRGRAVALASMLVVAVVCIGGALVVASHSYKMVVVNGEQTPEARRVVSIGNPHVVWLPRPLDPPLDPRDGVTIVNLSQRTLVVQDRKLRPGVAFLSEVDFTIDPAAWLSWD